MMGLYDAYRPVMGVLTAWLFYLGIKVSHGSLPARELSLCLLVCFFGTSWVMATNAIIDNQHDLLLKRESKHYASNNIRFIFCLSVLLLVFFAMLCVLLADTKDALRILGLFLLYTNITTANKYHLSYQGVGYPIFFSVAFACAVVPLCSAILGGKYSPNVFYLTLLVFTAIGCREILKDITDEQTDKIPGMMWYGVMSKGPYKMTLPVCWGVPKSIAVLKCFASVGTTIALSYIVSTQSLAYIPLLSGFLAQIFCPLRLKQPLLEVGMLGSLLLLTFF